MQAPLRKGKKEETLGRAKGVMRTSRSLLFGLLLVGLAASSSLVYTWQRLVVEEMLDVNFNREKQLELVEKNIETLKCEIAALETLERIETLARCRLDMVPLCWDDVVVIEYVKGRSE
jgi:cell division protein FtsL